MFLFTNIKKWYFKYERLVSSLSLVSGFVFNAVVLKRVDLFIENFWIIFHLCWAALGILLINLQENRDRRSAAEKRKPNTLHFWLIVFTQFAFGGLLSTFLVFYFRGATLGASWPFLFLLGIAFAANEIFKYHYARLDFQILILFLSIYLFAIFSVPVLVHRINAWVFLLSGLASLLVLGIFLYLLWFVAKERFRKNKTPLILCILAVVILVNLLYFTNIIPPLPLSLEDAGVYHSIVKTGEEEYVVLAEKRRWLDFFPPYAHFHKTPGEPVYVLSAVFSPAYFATSVVHKWQRYDGEERKWVTFDKITLPIFGGREGGYRTFSMRTELPAGHWRVEVETLRGAHIGRISFVVDDVAERPPLVETVKK